MVEYLVECEECENETIVLAYNKVTFCPCCGRRADVEKRRADIDDTELLLEYED